MRDALPLLERQGVAVMGVSPDKPDQQKKFDLKHQLGFALISDPEHEIAAAYGTWGEKKMYGKSYMGIIRSAILIGQNGSVEATWYGISPKDTVPELMKYLDRALEST